MSIRDMSTARRVLHDKTSPAAAELALDAELEQSARDLASKNAYPKGARVLMRKVLLLLDRRVRQARCASPTTRAIHKHDPEPLYENAWAAGEHRNQRSGRRARPNDKYNVIVREHVGLVALLPRPERLPLLALAKED